MRNDTFRAKSNQIPAVLMAAVVLLILLFSSFYRVHEADHICTGNDCPVCASISLCEQTVRQIGTALTYEAVLVIPVFYLAAAILPAVSFFVPGTPVLRKVRMNN